MSRRPRLRDAREDLPKRREASRQACAALHNAARHFLVCLRAERYAQDLHDPNKIRLTALIENRLPQILRMTVLHRVQDDMGYLTDIGCDRDQQLQP